MKQFSLSNNLKSRTLYMLAFVFGTVVSFAQMFPEKGMPQLNNYTPAQYQSKGKIWDIRSAPNGIVYMAADRGLLEFDGTAWQCFKGSDGFTRSLCIMNDSLIYTGSDLDFGVWKRDRHQSFEYSSLYPFRKDIQDVNEEFWDVRSLNGNILFVSSQNIYVYKNQQLIRINAPSKYTGSFAVNDSLYFSDEEDGLFLFDKVSLKQVFKYPDNVSFRISGVYHRNNGVVIVTKNAGLYIFKDGSLAPLKNAISEKLKTSRVFSFDIIGNSYLAFGTVMNGLFVTDLDGRIIHQVNKYKGLPSNTILSLHYAPSGKLWIGTDYGVSSLLMKNSITYFYDYRGDFGTGATALVVDGIFYLGTNQGLYMAGWDDLNNDMEFTRFQLVPGTVGQVWTLQYIGNTLFIGHDQGLLALEGSAVRKISINGGVWTILPYEDYLLTGNYNGIAVFRRMGNDWAFLKRMDLISGSCNQLVIEKGNVLWVNIPNFGMIRAVLDSNLHPSGRMIFPAKYFKGNEPCLAKDENGIHVVTDTRQYIFDAGSKKFIMESVTMRSRNVESLVASIYLPSPLHPDYDFYPVYNGFALKFLHYRDEVPAARHSVIIRKAEAYNNHERMTVFEGAKVPYKFNNLTIGFIVPHGDDVLYQYKLSGSEQWSSWVPENTAELIGLSHGSYSIVVRALIDGKIAGSNTMSFRIAAPWYRSWVAYAVYFALILLVAYVIRRWQQISLKKQKKKMLLKEQNSLRQQAEKHREKLMIMEQERLRSEYDQLKQQLKNKTIELANKSKDNEDKNRLLMSLKEKFDSVQKDPVTSKTRLGEIRRLLDSYLKADDRTFEIQMDELHQELFRKLKENYPSLSNNDLRLCAYLKVGLNSKEIADILNIQPSSSYISRSRLRKKLNLRPEEDLYDFLNAM